MKCLGTYFHPTRFPKRYQNIMVDEALTKISCWYKCLLNQTGKYFLINAIINSITTRTLNSWISDPGYNHEYQE